MKIPTRVKPLYKALRNLTASFREAQRAQHDVYYEFARDMGLTREEASGVLALVSLDEGPHRSWRDYEVAKKLIIRATTVPHAPRIFATPVEEMKLSGMANSHPMPYLQDDEE